MTVPEGNPAPIDELAALLERIRTLTPARVLAGRIGTSYRTETQLALREDHAVAVDAVHAEFDLERDFGTEFVTRWNLFMVETLAKSKNEYLLRPDLGRRLDDASIAKILDRSPTEADLQVAIGDGLSARAVVSQVPPLLPLLADGAKQLGLSFGQPMFIRHCRVGVMNDLGVHLRPSVVILLVGERPGLSTSESLSAYLGFRPQAGQTDAHRNLISNIHPQGTSTSDAAGRILQLATQMIRLGKSGVDIKEESHATSWPRKIR